MNGLSVVALDALGVVLPRVPVAIESQTGSSILDGRSDRIADGRVTPLRPGVIQLRIRTIGDSAAGAGLFLTATVSR